MEGTLASLESALGSMNAERLKTLEDFHELSNRNVEHQELINDLQSQAENDKAEWGAIRVDLEQQIEMLSDRVAAFERHYSGVASINNQEIQTATLYHRDGQQPNRPPPPSNDWVQCSRCHLPMMASVGSHPCPSIIDNLD